MSSDQLFASVEDAARDQVVVPLQQSPTALGRAAHSGAPRLGPAPGGARLARVEPARPSTVAQITDYFGRGRRSFGPASAAPLAPGPVDGRAMALPPAIAPHADALNRQLRQHIESHLDLIAAHTPALRQPVENVRRSIDLLLKINRS
jgi:hypothetical protein